MKHRFRNCYKNVSKFKKLLSTERGLYAESHEEEIVSSNHNAGRHQDLSLQDQLQQKQKVTKYSI